MYLNMDEGAARMKGVGVMERVNIEWVRLVVAYVLKFAIQHRYKCFSWGAIYQSRYYNNTNRTLIEK